MTICYDKLWMKMKEKNIRKLEMIKLSGITTNQMANMGKNSEVRLGVLIKVAAVLDCRIDDIVDYWV